MVHTDTDSLSLVHIYLFRRVEKFQGWGGVQAIKENKKKRKDYDNQSLLYKMNGRKQTGMLKLGVYA